MLRAVPAAAIAIGIACASCAPAPAAPARVETSRVVFVADTRDAARIHKAVAESEARLTEWLGPPPERNRVETVLPVHWRSTPPTMDVESSVAFAMARAWLPPATDSASAAVVDGAAWYLQSRIVETLYDHAFLIDRHSADRAPLFGGTWVVAFEWLPLDRWTAGIARGRQFTAAPILARGAAAFATLERYLTWPVLQGALSAWAQSGESGAAAARRVISAATGRDLDWFFDIAFDPARSIDYAVTALSTEAGRACPTPPCYRTTLMVANRGTAAFTGSSLPSGSFESGDAVEILVGFADGSQVMTRWDGRATTREFQFDSVAPVQFAAVDPSRVIVLDDNYLNNRIDLDRGEPPRVERWMARWFIWLQDAMLTLTT